jgi:hypothetical protein
VYGFIFYRDSGWVDVIVDDLLYTSIPKYEELSRLEKNLYHNDKDRFNSGARKGSQSLFFAKSGTENETWVYVHCLFCIYLPANRTSVDHFWRKRTQSYMVTMPPSTVDSPRTRLKILPGWFSSVSHQSDMY